MITIQDTTTEDDDDFQVPLPTIQQDDTYSDDDEVPEGWVLVPIQHVDKYDDVYEIIDLITEWAARENFGIIKIKHDTKRIYLGCKYSTHYQKEKEPKNTVQRQSGSYKTGCPFILRITFKSMGHGYWSLNEPKSLLEHSHNHPCSLEYNRVTSWGK